MVRTVVILHLVMSEESHKAEVLVHVALVCAIVTLWHKARGPLPVKARRKREDAEREEAEAKRKREEAGREEAVVRLCVVFCGVLFFV